MSRPAPEALQALLALRLAAGRRAAGVFRVLATHPAPEGLVAELGRTLAATYHRAAADELRALALMDITIVPVWRLPPRLSRAWPTPAALFVRGDPRLLERPALAVVGARHAHPTAMRFAFDRGRDAAGASMVLVSGGARGVDSAAHRGALEAGGVSLAYLGVAADRVYPAANAGLFRKILATGGALVSEHPPGPTTFKGEHAMRNRLIAAHGAAVVIVEAGESSGTLVTAAFAKKLETPVWVSPEGVGAERAGIVALTREGAAAVWRGIDACALTRLRDVVRGAEVLDE
ncbi:MAG: DNA-processing protein DprA [Deltaproteobacteria bacterium]|nr:DNA-processing protein DprA [Deltaproteobacteria bacterium]